MKHVILLGAPGSGKGTFSELLKKEGYIHLSMGDLLRAEVKSGSELGKEIDGLISVGKYVPDQLTFTLLSKFIKKEHCYIFDGFPRTTPQAKELLNQFQNLLVINFEIELELLKSRLVNRRSCPHCKEIYNLKTKRPLVDDTCDKCGTVGLFQRSDDKEEVLASRFEIFERETKPLKLVFEQSSCELITVDGKDDPELILTQVRSFLI